jgi:hypothetical protein
MIQGTITNIFETSGTECFSKKMEKNKEDGRANGEPNRNFL